MDNEKANAVLAAAQEFFREEESHGHLPMINDGPKAIGEKLGFPPAEVLVLLRMLHRRGMIALVGFGTHVTIAQSQDLLRPPSTVITDGGKSAKYGKGRRLRETEVMPEDEHPPEVEELQAYIAELEKMLDGVQAKADHAEQRRRNVSDARKRADEAKEAAEQKLREALAEVRRLNQTVETLQTKAGKVSELEREIEELRRPHALSGDLAATIARLTQ